RRGRRRPYRRPGAGRAPRAGARDRARGRGDLRRPLGRCHAAAGAAAAAKPLAYRGGPALQRGAGRAGGRVPGARLAQKYAVRTGGGTNHRIGLYDAVLIKENHSAAAGGVKPVLAAAARVAAQASFVEIEVETLAQLGEALDAGAKMVLLDNMDLPTLREAVRINAGRAVLEISGGVTLDGLRSLAETGVDRISVGALTKDVKATDFSMRLQEL